jgi:hypothetical protein
MGFLERIFGEKSPPPRPRPEAPVASTEDEQAIARYRYLLRTAPPEAIEEAHAEAFAQLTPEQRAMVLQGLKDELPPAESGSYANQSEPGPLARLATRAELRRPGTMERVFGGGGMGRGGMGMGGMFGGTLLSSIAGSFIGTAIAHQLLGGFGSPWMGAEAGGADAGQGDAPADEGGSDYADTGGDYADAGGDMGDFGGFEV